MVLGLSQEQLMQQVKVVEWAPESVSQRVRFLESIEALIVNR